MIKIICVGNIKEKYLRDAIEDYKKRITKYSKLEIIEVGESVFDDTDKNLLIESERIIKHIEPRDHIIILDSKGKQYNSIDFSKYIDKNLIHKDLLFVIGGSHGLSNSLKKMSNDIVSFSQFTFPHQLFRLILLEQIYRSFKIINNESYHK